jgi:hypothetical protein
LPDHLYLGLALLAFLAAAAVQYLLYSRILRPGLRTPPEERRRALLRWLAWAAAWQLAVLAAVAAYAIPLASSHPPGLAWIAPPVAAVVGTALPLQLAVASLARAAAQAR